MALPPTVQRHADNLEKCIPKFQAVLPAHLSAEKLNQTIINSLMQNKYLANCDPATVMQSAMTAAVLGLEVDNVTGQGYITPFRNKAQFVPGYRGYITLADNSGYLLQGHAVRENDHFKYMLGLVPVLEHTPAPGGPSERGPVQYVYATATSVNKPPVFKVLHVEQVNKIRDRSEAYKAFMAGKIKSTPWESDYEPMAVKTAIRALAPQLPLNVQKAAAIEGAHERGQTAFINEESNLEIIDGESQTIDSEATDDQPDLSKELDLGLDPDEEKTPPTGDGA